MAETESAALERLEAQRYTVQNQLSSVRTRLKNAPADRIPKYEERQKALLSERDRLRAEIEALRAQSR